MHSSSAPIADARDEEPAIATPPAVVVRPPPPAPRVASGPVAVRLTRFDRAREITLENTARGALTIEWTTDGLRASDGRRSRELTVQPKRAGALLRAGDREYAGSVAVRAGALGLEVENVLDLEDYVEGVVAAELSVWSTPPAALEAQAIASRSYAVAQMEARAGATGLAHFLDDTRDQAYGGALPAPWGAEGREVARRLHEAVESTRGLVLRENGRTVDARFHAACGGHTADAADVFPEAAHFECLRGVLCEPCSRASSAAREASTAEASTWRFTASAAQLNALARSLELGERVVSLSPARSDAAGRWLAVDVEGSHGRKVIPFEELRRRLSPTALSSSAIVSTWPRAGQAITAGVSFTGRGRGHGVGLCQSGALVYAQRGESARAILQRYYPGAEVVDGR